MVRPSWKALVETATEALFRVLEQEDEVARATAHKVEESCLDWIGELPNRSPYRLLALTSLMDVGCYFWPQWPTGIHSVVMKYGGVQLAADYIFRNMPAWSIKGYPTRKHGEFTFLVAERGVIAALDSAIFWSQVPMLYGADLTCWELTHLH